MAGIIETANNAYEARDRANNEIESLKDQAKREAEDFQNQLKDLAQLAETNRKAREFANMASDNKHDDYNRDMDNDKTIKAKNQRLLKETAIDPHLAEEFNELKLHYCKIEAATNISDIDVLIKDFEDMEDKNFNLFKYVVDLSNEVETLENQIKEFKEEKKKYDGNGGANTMQKNKYLKNLDNESLNSRNKTEFYSSKCSSAQKTLNSVKKLVQSLSSTIMCDTGASPDINKNEGVTESNILPYMSLIEDRVIDVIFAYNIIKAQEKNNHHGYDKKHTDKNMNGKKDNGFKEMPSLDESLGSDDGVEISKPLTYDQLRKKAETFLEQGPKRSKISGKTKGKWNKK